MCDTKFETLPVTTGVSGTEIELRANFMRLLSRPLWALYQYHVDYKPPMESRRLRSALLFQHEETLGKAHTFDGAILFLPNKLHNTVCFYILNVLRISFKCFL